jgi:hypothetical protein
MVYYTVQDRTSIERVWWNVLPLPSEWLNLMHVHGAITQNAVFGKESDVKDRKLVAPPE